MNAHLLDPYIVDAEAGAIYWKATGGRAGRLHHSGYWALSIGGKHYQQHRLVWLAVHGEMPNGLIDHVNGDRGDNRISNLRIVDHSTNLENQRHARADNRLGILGVRKRSSGGFDARIWLKGKPLYLGMYPTAEQASAAYVEAKRQLHAGCTL